jgi:hypothetical protein
VTIRRPDWMAGCVRSALAISFILLAEAGLPGAAQAAPISMMPISVAISPGRPNYRWTGNTYNMAGCVQIIDFGKVIEAEAPKLLEAVFDRVGIARNADEEAKAKASGLLLTIDISRVLSKWRGGALNAEFDSAFDLILSIFLANEKIWTSPFVDTEVLAGDLGWNPFSCLKEGVEKDMTSQLKRMLVKVLGSLPNDQKLLAAIDDAEQQISGPVVELLTGLKSVEARYRVTEADSGIRKRPDQKSPLLRKLGVGSIVQVIGQLPSGWLQVAKDGEAIGWIQEGAVIAMQKTITEGTATATPSAAVPPAPSFAAAPVTETFPTRPVAVSFPRGKLNPDDIAVIIGNANYKATAKDIPDVVPAYADAEGMKRYAMQALGIKEENIIFIKDARFKDMVATFGSAENFKGKLFNWIKPNQSNVFVFYSGHGAPSGDGTSSYLVPVDAEASLIDLSGYSLKTLYGNLGKLPAKSVTVVLEACFSGASQSGMLVKNASPIYQKATQEVVPANLTVISAGSGNQIASWEQDKSHGLFTKHFLLGMAGAADKKPYGNGDGKVGTEELTAYLKGTMTYMAQRYYGREQTAQIAVGR